MQTPKPKLHMLLHSADLVEERLRIQLNPLGITPRQARILEALDRIGACSQVTLAREFNISAASMSTMTTRLISAGFILRAADPDQARSNLLSLSDTGRALLSDVHRAWREVDKIIETAIGPESAAELAGLARQLRNALGGRAPGHGARGSKLTATPGIEERERRD
ncbi:MarR family transcriptional regulator [Gymnodinialimonas sp. 2305UL16-5]|uniref:MarR family winged helix-turn-helix transcriptional regulator n=1 Tax=Gymnodinialimonas mytili TaxID=3126503 RepID=UPI0030A397BF